MRKSLWLPLLALIAVLFLVPLVPSSPVLEVDTPTVLWASSVDPWGGAGGVVITVYGVMIALGAALSALLTAAISRKLNQGLNGLALALVSGLCALLCSHLLFCVLRWGYILNDLAQSPAYLFQLWKGGYTMYGALLGALLGAFIYAKAAGHAAPLAVDAILPGMALLITIGRGAECFTGQGMGTYAVNEALHMLPFVTTNEWGDAQLHVYAYEAIAACAVFIASTMILMKGKASAGRVTEIGLTILSSAQLLLDSWRGDELIRFGFVRLNMVCAAMTLLVLMVLRVHRAIRADGGVRLWTWLRAVLLVVGLGMVTLIEFALDKSFINNTLLYAVMTMMVIMLGCVVLIDGSRKQTEA